jgi:mRNA interferase MazF
MGIKAFDIYLVNLDPTVGTEIKKSRPCLILSPEQMNNVLGTVIIAPMTTSLRGYPSRVQARFQNKSCEICLDQMRAVDQTRLGRRSLGRLRQDDADCVKAAIAEVFQV